MTGKKQRIPPSVLFAGSTKDTNTYPPGGSIFMLPLVIFYIPFAPTGSITYSASLSSSACVEAWSA